MSFPDRRGPGTDVSDLYARVRAGMRARDIRNASLAPGDGLEVRDANGNVTWAVGTSGGKHGLLRNVPGVGWRTVEEDAQNKIDWLNGVVTTRFEAAESRIGTNETRIAEEASRTTLQWTSIDSLTSRMGTAEGRITTESSRTDLQWQYINRAEANIQILRTYATTLQQVIAAIIANMPNGPTPPPGIPPGASL